MTFITKPGLYAHNMITSAETHARPVVITGAAGDSNGVGIFREKVLRAILTEADAIRLADEIIDSLERTPKP